jgi:hypothetical protein
MFAPTSSAAEPAALKPADVKIQAAAVKAAIERAHGPIVLVCPGARPELAAYNTCKQQCAERAAQAPITPADLQACGSMTAQECATWLIEKRAKECIQTPGAGCADEYGKLQNELLQCKKCAELKQAEAAAEKDLAAKLRAYAAAKAAYERAAAALFAAKTKEQRLEDLRKRICAAAAK